MSRFNNKTQFGHTYIHECICGADMLRVTKDPDSSHGGPYHTLEFYGFYTTGRKGLWGRLKLAWRVIRGKEFIDASIMILPSQARALGEAIIELAGDDGE